MRAGRRSADAETIDAAPFTAWLDARLTQIRRDPGTWRHRDGGEATAPDAEQLLARELDGIVTGDFLRKGAFRRTGVIDRAIAENIVDRAGGEWWRLYPDEHDQLEDEAFCERCHELVTPIDGVCPWCEDNVVDAFRRERRWCEREDRMVFPANDGSCWRCGGRTLRGVPYAPCACGCDETIRRFDRHGRPVQYVRGHAPRSLEKPSGAVPIEPFATYLEDRLQKMDLLQALAREHGISRDDVVSILARRDDIVDRDIVRRAMWVAGRGGTGKGLPMRPGAPGFFDLYPADKRSRTCPGCGHGKAPHAEMCKPCRTKANRRDGTRPPTAITRLSDEVIAEAYALYSENGMSLMEAAESVFERTPHRNVGSTAQALSRMWKQRGWPMRDRTRAVA